MKKRVALLAGSILSAIVILAVTMVLLGNIANPGLVVAAPDDVKLYRFSTAQVVSADAASTGQINLREFESIDLQLYVDVNDSNVNTTTVYLQHTCDGTHWEEFYDQTGGLATISADTSVITTVKVACENTRIYFDVTGTSTGTVTATVVGLAKKTQP